MKIETILNAFAWSERLIVLEKHPRRSRQYRAFRARILKMFSIGRSINADLNTEIEMQKARIERILAQLDAHKLSNEFALEEKDKRIADLKAENQAMEYLLNEGENVGVE